MTWRPWLERAVLRQMTGLPGDGFDTLVRVLARVCDDPYDRVHSAPVSADGRRRLGDDSGFIVFDVNEDEGLVRVFELVWSG